MKLLSRFPSALTVTLAAACISPACSDSGSLAGIVTSDVPGSPAIAGACVRTEGEPGYSCTSSSNGTYSLVLPQGAQTILVSAPGHNPKKVNLSVAGGTTTRSFALGTASTGTVVNMPAPLEWGEPADMHTYPGDDFPIAFTDMGSLPAEGTPRIAEWNRIVKPDESFTMSGVHFTTRSGADAGTDTVVWIYARAGSGAVLRQAKVWRVTENTITCTLPDDIPFGMYLVWVENSVGVGSPICLNKTSCRWVGPLGNTASAGDTKRVFGENISYNHGTTTSYVYIQPATGGAMTGCAVTKVDPYAVSFTVPAGTPNGNYRVFVHNGHGGVYGWGDGLDLVIQDRFMRGATEVSLTPTGTDDTSAIQTAIDALTALPAGGTLRLSAGNFKTYDTIYLRSRVRVVGAGMDSTTVELRENSAGRKSHLWHGGNQVALESLTLRACLDSPYQPTYGIMGVDYPVPNVFDAKFINLRVTADFGTVVNSNNFGDIRTEVSGCEFYRTLIPGSSDAWVRNCNLYGGPYAVVNPYVTQTEAAYHVWNHSILEYSHIETKDWPINPVTGSRNYWDWITTDDPNWNNTVGYKVWAKRISLGGAFGVHDSYIAYNTTKDVAVQDNKGEMILFHGGVGQWFGNVLSTSGLTLNLRTDGLVNGETSSTGSYGNTLYGGQPVPDALPDWVPLDGSSAIVVAGRGMGQQRIIASHTTASITVEKSWRVQPDATSIIIITPTYRGHVVYGNDLNAFPIGYNQQASASTGVDFDGNAIGNYVEGNVSRRTNTARSILANGGSPTYWNSMRDERAIDCFSGGLSIFMWTDNSAGCVMLGNSFANCSVNIYGSTTSGAGQAYGEGSILEHLDLTAKKGYGLNGVGISSRWMEGFTLYRGGAIKVIDGPSTPAATQPVYIASADRKQFLIGNSYSGPYSATYAYSSGLFGYSVPAPVYRSLRVKGYTGHTIDDVLVPVANAGTQAMSWSVSTSEPWLSASVVANGNLAPESTLGRIAVVFNTSGMSAGTYWGSITISDGANNVKVGVCLTLLSGTPANASPVASFTSIPAIGATPLAVAFDAGASHDTDGSIVSYRWDFGDGGYGSGVTATHTYTNSGTYAAQLTVTDDSGGVGTAWSGVTVVPALTSISLVGSPAPPIAPSTPVTLTATVSGGYQVQYKFLLKTDTGWHTLRDYANGNTCVWTPSTAGYYEVKVWAKNQGTTNAYDLTSQSVGYPVGLLPAGAKLWLKADAGVSANGATVSAWADQSGTGNNVVETVGNPKPVVADNSITGKPAIRFTGPGQMLQCNNLVLLGNTAFTSFTVSKFNQISANAYQYIWWNGSEGGNNGYGCYLYSSGNTRCAWGGNSGPVTDPSPARVASIYRIGSRFTGVGGTGPHELWINGSLVNSGGKSKSNLSGGAFTVGNYGPSSGSGLYGDVAEILIYDRALLTCTQYFGHVVKRLVPFDWLRTGLAIGTPAPSAA